MEKKKILTILIGFLLILSISTSYYFLVEDDDDVEDDEGYDEEGPWKVDIVFDRSIYQYWDIWNPGVMGYSKTADLLQEYGFNVSQNSLPLEERIQSMDPESSILFLGPAPSSTSNYTDGEITEIERFVTEGGRLIVVGEHDNQFGMSDFQNKLAKRFGVLFEHSSVLNIDDNLGDKYWLKGRSKYFDLDNIGFRGLASLNYPSKAEKLCTVKTVEEGNVRENKATCVGLKHGRGKVVFVGDTHFLWNGKSDLGLDYGQNREFLAGLLEYLLDREMKKSTFDTDYSLITGNSFDISLYFDEKIRNLTYDIRGGDINISDKGDQKITYEVDVEEDGFVRFGVQDEPYKYVHFLKPKDQNSENRKVLFDTSHHGRAVHEGPSGLLKFAKILRDEGFFVFAEGFNVSYDDYDAVFFPSPSKNFSETELDMIEDIDKTILFGDFRTSLEAEYLGIYQNLKKWDVEYVYPLNEIGEKIGIEFTHFTVADDSENPFRHTVNFQENSSELFYSCSLELNGNYTTINTSENAWGEINPWEPWYVTRSSYDLNGPLPVIAWNESVFASGDISLLENQRIDDNRWLVKKISDWIDR